MVFASKTNHNDVLGLSLDLQFYGLLRQIYSLFTYAILVSLNISYFVSLECLAYMSSIKTLNVTNFEEWNETLCVVLAIYHDVVLCFKG
jgi:uncharacterized membrane protein YhdT